MDSSFYNKFVLYIRDWVFRKVFMNSKILNLKYILEECFEKYFRDLQIFFKNSNQKIFIFKIRFSKSCFFNSEIYFKIVILKIYFEFGISKDIFKIRNTFIKHPIPKN